DARRTRNRRATRVHRCHHAVFLCPGDHRRVVVRRLHAAEAGLRQPHALLRDLLEVRLDQARLEDDRAGIDAHAARAQVLEALFRRYGERLDAFRILRPAGHVHFRGADGGRGAAVRIAFEEADRPLTRRPVAEGVVHLRVDQSRDGGCAVGVNHHVERLQIGRRRSDGGYFSIGHLDAVALGVRCAPVAGDDGAEIDDRRLHDSFLAIQSAHTCSAGRWLSNCVCAAPPFSPSKPTICLSDEPMASYMARASSISTCWSSAPCMTRNGHRMRAAKPATRKSFTFSTAASMVSVPVMNMSWKRGAAMMPLPCILLTQTRW